LFFGEEDLHCGGGRKGEFGRADGHESQVSAKPG
jgi:hypothetical protein